MIRKLVASILILLLFLALLSSCGKAQNIDVDKGYLANTVRISCGSTLSGTILQVMMLKGFLQNAMPQDVKVEWTIFEDFMTANEDMMAGRADLLNNGLPVMISSVTNKMPVSLVSSMLFIRTELFTSQEGINSINDLTTNDKISINGLAGVNEFSLMLLAKEEFGDYRYFQNSVVAASNADAIASLQLSDAFTASILSYPAIQQAQAIDGVRVLADLTPTIEKNGLAVAVIANKTFHDENPALIDIFLQVERDTIEYIKNNTEEVAVLLTDYFKIDDVAGFEQVLRETTFQLEVSESGYNNIANLMYEIGILSTPPKPFNQLPNYDRIPKVA